jgi:hypothetical protein
LIKFETYFNNYTYKLIAYRKLMAENIRVVSLLLSILIITGMLLISSQLVTPSQSLEQKLVAKLSGDAEVPPVKTNGTGEVYFQLNNGTIKYTVNVTNIDNVTLAHLFRGIVGNNGPIIGTLFNGSSPTGEMSGILSRGNITSNLLKGPLQGRIISDLINLVNNGSIYVNVRTLDFPNGEIRGQLTNLTG